MQFYKSDLEALLLLHSKPYGIHLEDCSLFDDNTTTATASCTTQRRNNNKYKSQCSLQRFALQNTRLSQSCFQGILQTILQQVPTLQYLCLSAPQDRLGQGVDDTDGINLTPFLKKVLMVDRNNHNCDIHNNCDDHQNVLQQHPSPPKQQQRTPLQTLKLEGLYVEPRFLVQYLQTTQKSQTNTTTVPYIEYRYHGHLWTSVQYCSALRHFGQYTCQSLRSSRLQLIQHLTELEEYDEMDTEYKTVVRYGLLVESPGLWASTSE